MIKELHIANLAVIEDTTLEFHSAYTALIGTTGAGKSLIVNSLSLLNGERSDFSLVRDKNKKAYVSAIFHLDENFISRHSEVKPYLNDGELMIKRILNPDKSSRYLLSDEPVTLSLFKEVTSHLIDIHSQNGKNDLLDETKQINYVDLYGGKKIQNKLESYQKAYQDYVDIKEEYRLLFESKKELDRDYLQFQIHEIEKYNLQENEIEELNKEYSSLRDYEKIKEKYDAFFSSTSDSEGDFSSKVDVVISKLNLFTSTPMEEIAKEMREHLYQIKDDLDSIEEKFSSFDVDPRRVDEINARLFQLKDLQRKYGKTSQEILSKYQTYKQQLSIIDSFEDEKIRYEKDIEKKRQIAYESALELSKLRQEAGEKLSSAIGKEMADLALRKNAFRVEITQGELSPLGIDNVRFLISLNQGLDEASLAKAASGGESSRLMLSLKVVLNQLDPYDLLIFDEIDTGVSGQIASLIAKKIKRVSLDSPLLVISHLPQVVASSEEAILIEKKQENGSTITKAKSLDQDSFIQQVSKMLSGDKVTPAAILQAKELISEYHKSCND